MVTIVRWNPTLPLSPELNLFTISELIYVIMVRRPIFFALEYSWVLAQKELLFDNTLSFSFEW